MSKYALIGSPIRHSLSPQLFRLFGEQLGRELDYQALDVKPSELSPVLHRLQQQGYHGLNLTLPLKELGFDLVDESSLVAQKAKAINVITFQEDSSILGENTDGLGFIRDLQGNKGFSLEAKSVLILGAGGAVRGLMGPLIEQRPSQVVIANRTELKAQALARAYADSKNPVISVSWDRIADFSYDLVVQGTSAGLQGESLALPGGILKPHACCYDLIYGKGAEPFLAWAKEQGAVPYDGLGMLVEQAAEAFYLWEDQRIDTSKILVTLSK